VVCLDCGKQFSYDGEQMRIMVGQPTFVATKKQRLAALLFAGE
jgi:hypothetical protein